MSLVDPHDHICVVGGSLAAATAAGTIRRSGHRGRITLLSDEDVLPYTRPPLSKTVLTGADTPESIRLPAPEGVDMRLGCRATGLDLATRHILVDGGAAIHFDGLVIATGARARAPVAAEGAVRTLRSMADAVGLREAMRGASTMVVIGAGPLAMEVASSARSLGLAVTVVANKLPMQAHLGTPLATTLLEYAAQAGVDVIVDDAGAQVCSDDGRTTVTTQHGQRHTADVTVAAIGCAPNVEWLAGSGLELTPQGLVVDHSLYAGDRITAAGDVAAVHCAQRGVRRTPLWFSAVDQARLAATNLVTNRAQPYESIPLFWTEMFGHRLRVAGTIRDDAELEIDRRERGTLYRWLTPDGTVEAAAALDLPLSIARLAKLVAQPEPTNRGTI